MTDPSVSPSGKPSEHQNEWDRSERRSTRIALAIALAPIPLALAISWSQGSPPWKERPTPALENHQAPMAPAHDWPPPYHR